MKTARDEMDIVNAYQAVGTYPGRRSPLRHHPQDGQTRHRPPPARSGWPSCSGAPIAAPMADLIAARVRKSDGRISAKRLLPVAQAPGTAARRGTSGARCGREGAVEARAAHVPTVGPDSRVSTW